jgi:hypothetical protein
MSTKSDVHDDEDEDSRRRRETKLAGGSSTMSMYASFRCIEGLAGEIFTQKLGCTADEARHARALDVA